MANIKVHPFDLLKKRKKRKEYRKLLKKKQKIRDEKLKKLTPEKLLTNIRKINNLVQEKGTSFSKRNEKKLKNYKIAYQDVLNNLSKKRHLKSFCVNGIEKIFGKASKNILRSSEHKKEKETEKQNKEVDGPEFPPGFSFPLQVHFPPGIYPRDKNKCIKESLPDPIYKEDNYRKSTNITQKTEIISNDSLGSYSIFNGKKNVKSYSNFFDPINPTSPFFMHHPKLQHSLELKLGKKEDHIDKQIKHRNLQLSFIGPGDVTQTEKEIFQKILSVLTRLKIHTFKLSYKQIKSNVVN